MSWREKESADGDETASQKTYLADSVFAFSGRPTVAMALLASVREYLVREKVFEERKKNFTLHAYTSGVMSVVEYLLS